MSDIRTNQIYFLLHGCVNETSLRYISSIISCLPGLSLLLVSLHLLSLADDIDLVTNEEEEANENAQHLKCLYEHSRKYGMDINLDKATFYLFLHGYVNVNQTRS